MKFSEMENIVAQTVDDPYRVALPFVDDERVSGRWKAKGFHLDDCDEKTVCNWSLIDM